MLLKRLLHVADALVEEIVTKEAQKGDTKKIKFSLTKDLVVTLEGPTEGLEVFQKGQVVNIEFTQPQNMLPGTEG